MHDRVAIHCSLSYIPPKKFMITHNHKLFGTVALMSIKGSNYQEMIWLISLDVHKLGHKKSAFWPMIHVLHTCTSSATPREVILWWLPQPPNSSWTNKSLYVSRCKWQAKLSSPLHHLCYAHSISECTELSIHMAYAVCINVVVNNFPNVSSGASFCIYMYCW